MAATFAESAHAVLATTTLAPWGPHSYARPFLLRLALSVKRVLFGAVHESVGPIEQPGAFRGSYRAVLNYRRFGKLRLADRQEGLRPGRIRVRSSRVGGSPTEPGNFHR